MTFSMTSQLYTSVCVSSNTMQATSGHAWYVHEGHTEGNGACTDHIGAQYNPYGVNTTEEAGYLDDCTSLSQQRCAMGDLGGKLGTLELEPVTTILHKTYSFYDENLHLLAPFTSEFRKAKPMLCKPTNIECMFKQMHHAQLFSIHSVLCQSSTVPLWCMALVSEVVNSLVVPTLSHHL